ncbi:Not1 N-terminal domain, CCR4-Not complex component-domain-containing protein, partial [Syncephalis pseudoplumigaleata]
AEIDRVFKKVSEGVETFDGIFRKLENTENINQKEKHEQDLKKEIKKLQRLREQIKNWISSSDIKDKTPLVDQRRLIEQKMELFKACEKEMKTKAFSKEGLTLAARMDPKDKEKQEISSWITRTVEDLSTQIDGLEAEAERLQVGLRKNKKSAEKYERISTIDECVQRHKWHMGRLELILRLLENGNISSEQVQRIRDDVEYYVENNQDPDFAEDEEIYDELNLEAEEELYTVGMGEEPQSSHGSVSPAVSNAASAAPSPARKQTTAQLYSVTAQASLNNSAPSIAAKLANAKTPAPTIAAVPKTSSKTSEPTPPASTVATASNEPSTSSPSKDANKVSGADQPPSTALADLIATFETAKQKARTRHELGQYQQMLDQGCLYLPGSLDAERPKQYIPKNVHPTPAYYPTTPSPLFDNPLLFDKLSSDALFFIFYYQQGTYQQYLAARSLKKKSWRYHKKYQTWFQRHEEPIAITDEYEMGTYIYFDYEGAWCQRKKTEFRFEYRYLEDAELV